MPSCRKCGKGAQEIAGYLTRVNETGVPGIWECRPSCSCEPRSFEKNLMDAIMSGDMKDEKVEREAVVELHELDATLTEIKDKLRSASARQPILSI